MRNFFDVNIRFECKNYEKLKSLVLYIPQSVDYHFNLSRNLIVLPNTGLDEKENNIYTITFEVHGYNIKSKLAYRKQINYYLKQVSKSIEQYIKHELNT